MHCHQSLCLSKIQAPFDIWKLGIYIHPYPRQTTPDFLSKAPNYLSLSSPVNVSVTLFFYHEAMQHLQTELPALLGPPDGSLKPARISCRVTHAFTGKLNAHNLPSFSSEQGNSHLESDVCFPGITKMEVHPCLKMACPLHPGITLAGRQSRTKPVG